MDAPTSKFLFLFLLSILFVCSGAFLSTNKDFKQTKRHHHHKILSHRALLKTIQHDFINPPIATYPTTPVTNPATTPVPVTATPDTSTPTVVTIPSVNPVTITPITPNPVNNPPVPITNPVTTFPGGQPIGNPVTTYPTPLTAPAVVPPVTTNAPAVPGQSWCVAKGGVPESSIQAALDYACGIGGADCASIQQGASCYNPATMQNHASYAFNSYYQRNPVQTSCDFGGCAFVTNVNPSSGSCIYPTGSSTTASPITTFPTPTTNPTPTTSSSSGATPTSTNTPPNFLNPTNPALGGATTGFGLNPTTITNSSSISSSNGLRPFFGCIVVVTSIITGKLVLH